MLMATANLWLPAVTGLIGTAVGVVASVATTWMNQRGQADLEQERSRFALESQIGTVALRQRGTLRVAWRRRMGDLSSVK